MTLSDRIFTLRRDKEIGHPEDVLLTKDVKEFIRECEKQIMLKGRRFNIYKLAGPKLT